MFKIPRESGADQGFSRAGAVFQQEIEILSTFFRSTKFIFRALRKH